jgi:hypothetical protein
MVQVSFLHTTVLLQLAITANLAHHENFFNKVNFPTLSSRIHKNERFYPEKIESLSPLTDAELNFDECC